MAKKRPRIDVLNGPNLNLLGQREPHIYGHASLQDVERLCKKNTEALGFDLVFFQSNSEGALVDAMQESGRHAKGLLVNLAGFSHSSVALLDTALALEIPLVEVHISNIFAREAFRHHSLISQAAKGVICGLGIEGYRFALEALAKMIQEQAMKEGS